VTPMTAQAKYEYTRPWLYPKQLEAIFHTKRYGMVEASTKAGKAQPLDALISTPRGWKKMGDLRVGNVIHGKGGKCKVVGIYPQGKRKTYRITFSDGSNTLASDDHLWTVQSSRGKERLLTTQQILDLPYWDFKRSYIPQHSAVDYQSEVTPIDPWLLGFLTGDGGFTTDTLRVAIDCKESEIIQRVKMACNNSGCNLVYQSRSDWIIKKPKERYKHPIIQALKKIGLWGLYSHQKYAPDFIKYGSIETRLEYIRGLFDADGYVNKHGQPSIEQTSPILASDVTHIVRSLGGVIKNTTKENSYLGKNGIRISAKKVYRQYISIDCPESLFSLQRKKNKCVKPKKKVKRTFKSIEYVGLQECQCIEVDADDHLYLTDDFITTHNTVGCIVWIFEQAIQGKAGDNYWWVAPIYSQAKIAYRRLKRFLPVSLFKANETELTITLPNGAVIWFKGADNPDSLYGEDVKAAVGDEASRWKDEAFHALRSTLTATRGMLRLIGNVKGKKNFFYQMCRRAESGTQDMEYHVITAYDAVAGGVLQLEEVEDAKRQLPEQVFNELYLCKPSDDGGNPFGIAAIRACIAPLSNKPVVAWGIDLAKSYDWTVAIGLDDEGRTAKFERWQSPWQETKRRIKAMVGSTPALIDSTGVGDPVLEDIQEGSQGNFEGFKFSSASKQQLMEGLAVAIQSQKVEYPEGHIVTELEQFEYEYTRTGVKYCMTPKTKVLTSDLKWVELGKLQVGDNLLAFDEYPQESRKGRDWRISTITQHSLIQRPCYDIYLENGEVLTASKEHLWLVDVGNDYGHKWIKTEDLRGISKKSKSLRYAPHHLSKVIDVWQESKDYDIGYLAGVLDGEGCIQQSSKHNDTGHNLRVSFSQRDNEVAKECRQILNKNGFSFSESKGNGKNKNVISFGITGGRQDVLKLLGIVRPKRLLKNFDANKLGVLTKKEKVKIIKIVDVGIKDVVAMETTTKTFVAEGYATHNSAPQGMHDDCVCALALAVSKMSVPKTQMRIRSL